MMVLTTVGQMVSSMIAGLWIGAKGNVSEGETFGAILVSDDFFTPLSDANNLTSSFMEVIAT